MSKRPTPQVPTGAPVVHPLPERLPADAAGALIAALSTLRGKPLAIDASAVQLLTTPVVQVLLAARRTWSEAALPFAVTAASQPFRQAVASLGLAAAALALEE